MSVAHVRSPAQWALCFVLSACLADGGISSRSAPLPSGPPPFGEVDSSVSVVASQSVGSTFGQFATSLDGEAQYEIPIETPQGRAGVEPSLSIQYGSRSGDGLLGMGFSLIGLSALTPCARTLAVDGRVSGVRFRDDDALCLDGQRLVLVSGQAGSPGAIYRHEVQPGPRIEALSEGFRVHRRDGAVADYGLSPASQHRVSVSRQLREDGTAGSSRLGIAAWLIERVSDRSGNTMTVSYEQAFAQLVDGGVYRGRGVWPSRITYTGTTGGDAGSREVVFSYEDRPDPSLRLMHGAAITLTKRLRRISTFAPRGGNRVLVRAYELRYRNDSNTKRSLLRSVQECDGLGTCKPATRFRWQLGAQDESGNTQGGVSTQLREWAIQTPSEWFDLRVGGKRAVLPITQVMADVDGNGTDDMLYMVPGGPTGGGTLANWRLMLRLPGQGFVEVTPDSVDSILSSSINLTVPVPVDLNGDGAFEVLYFEPRIAEGDRQGRLRTVRSGVQSLFPLPSSSIVSDVGACISCETFSVAGDLDGNGVSDLLTHCQGVRGPGADRGAPYDCQNTPDKRFDVSNWRSWLNPSKNNAIPLGRDGVSDLFQETGVRMGAWPRMFDIDGDGKDELLVQSRFFGEDTQPTFEETAFIDGEGNKTVLNLDPGAVGIFLDINGDGLEDHLRYEGSPRVRLNLGGAFGAEYVAPIDDSPLEEQGLGGGAFDHLGRTLLDIQAADLNRDGRDDLLVYYENIRQGGIVRPGSQSIVAHLSDGLGFVRHYFGPAGLQAEDELTGSRSWPTTKLYDDEGDGDLDVLIVGIDEQFETVRNTGEAPDLLVGIDSGDGQAIDIDYADISDPAVHTPAVLCNAAQRCLRKGMDVVSEHTHRLTRRQPQEARRFRYRYREGRMDLEGRGFLGFASRERREQVDGLDVVERVSMDNRTRVGTHYPYANIPERTFRCTPDAPKRHRVTENSRYDFKASDTAPGSYALHLVEHQTRFFEDQNSGVCDGGRVVSNAPLISVTERYRYDAYDNLLGYQEVTGGAGSTESRVFEFVYDNRPEDDIIGLRTMMRATIGGPELSLSTVSALQDGGGAGDCVSAVGEDGIVRCVSPAEIWLRYTETYAYDERALLSQSVSGAHLPPGSPHRVTQAYGRDAQGLVSSLTQSTGAGLSRRTDIGYDTEGVFPVVVQNSAGHARWFAFDAGLGVIVATADPNGISTTHRYDGFGRPRGTTRADGTTQVIDYLSDPGASLKMRVLDAGGRESELTFDEMGNLSRVRDKRYLAGTASAGGFRQESFIYNVRGDLVRYAPPSDGASPPAQRYSYDRLGRLTAVTRDGVSGQTRVAYHGLRTETVDAKGHGSFEERDPQGRPIARGAYVDASGAPIAVNILQPPSSYRGSAQVTRYTYASTGQLREITNPAGFSYLLGYDDGQHRNSLQDLRTGRQRRFEYNGFGELVAEHASGASSIAYERDAIGRLTRVITTDGDYLYSWDTGARSSGGEQPGGPALGTLGAMTSPDGVVTSYVYDSVLRPSDHITQVAGKRYRFSMIYDAEGQLTELRYPEARDGKRYTVGYRYAFGDLRAAEEQDGDTGKPLWEASGYDARGFLAGEVFGNGVSTERTRNDATGRTLETRIDAPSGDTLSRRTYTHDLAGNTLTRNEAGSGSPESHDAVADFAERFSYDGLDRLRRRQAGSRSFRYDYDLLGNLTMAESLSSSLDTEGTQAVLRHLQRYGESGASAYALTTRSRSGESEDDPPEFEETYSYDSKGRVTSGGGRSIAYNAFDKPTRIADGAGDTRYTYDASLRRIRKVSPEETSVRIAGLFEERTRAGQTTYHHLVYGGGRSTDTQAPAVQVDKTKDGTEKHYLHRDELGSVHLVTDEAATVAESRRYDPWGRRIDADGAVTADSDSSVKHGFGGHLEESSRGLIDMGGRFYDPTTARFLSQDPFAEPVGQGLNRYAYALNNPLRFVDPSGYQLCDTRSQSCGQGTSGGTGGVSGPPPSTVDALSSTKLTPVGPGGTRLSAEGPRTPRIDRGQGRAATFVTNVRREARQAGIALMGVVAGLTGDLLPRGTQLRDPQDTFGHETSFHQGRAVGAFFGAAGSALTLLGGIALIGTAAGGGGALTLATGGLAAPVPAAGIAAGAAGTVAGAEGLRLYGEHLNQALKDLNTHMSSVKGSGQGAGGSRSARTSGHSARSASAAARGAPQVAGRGFRSFSAAKRALGPAGPRKQWHHIVEQGGNIERFGAEAIHNTSNLVRVDTAVHRQISGFYSSKQPFTGGQTVRQWLRSQSFDEQMQFGLGTLRRFGGGQ